MNFFTLFTFTACVGKTATDIPSINSLDLEVVKEDLMRKDGVLADKADRTVRDYRRFLAMVWEKRGDPDFRMIPGYLVDLAWHRHIQHTEKYWNDTLTVFGTYIGHQPGSDEGDEFGEDGTEDATQEHQDPLEPVLQLYREMFHDEPELDLWDWAVEFQRTVERRRPIYCNIHCRELGTSPHAESQSGPFLGASPNKRPLGSYCYERCEEQILGRPLGRSSAGNTVDASSGKHSSPGPFLGASQNKRPHDTYCSDCKRCIPILGASPNNPDRHNGGRRRTERRRPIYCNIHCRELGRGHSPHESQSGPFLGASPNKPPLGSYFYEVGRSSAGNPVDASSRTHSSSGPFLGASPYKPPLGSYCYERCEHQILATGTCEGSQPPVRGRREVVYDDVDGENQRMLTGVRKYGPERSPEESEAAIADEDLSFLERRLQNKKSKTPEEAARLVEKYREFLIAQARSGKLADSPAGWDEEIDVVWGMHTLFTAEYRNFSEKAAGRYIHFMPKF